LKDFGKKNRKERAGVAHTLNRAAFGPTNGVHLITAHGGRFPTRDGAAKVYEQGATKRVTVTEFDSVGQDGRHNSFACQEALKALGDTCERDVRNVSGLR
jgi:uncharacterized protein (DUF1330 family)